MMRALDTNNDRVAHKDRILKVIKETFRQYDKQALMAKLEKTGLPFAPINRPTDLFDDPHLNAAGGLVNVTLTRSEQQGKRVALPLCPWKWVARVLICTTTCHSPVKTAMRCCAPRASLKEKSPLYAATG